MLTRVERGALFALAHYMTNVSWSVVRVPVKLPQSSGAASTARTSVTVGALAMAVLLLPSSFQTAFLACLTPVFMLPNAFTSTSDSRGTTLTVALRSARVCTQDL